MRGHIYCEWPASLLGHLNYSKPAQLNHVISCSVQDKERVGGCEILAAVTRSSSSVLSTLSTSR